MLDVAHRSAGLTAITVLRGKTSCKSSVRISAAHDPIYLTHPAVFRPNADKVSLPLGPPSEDSRNSQTHSPSLTEFSEIIIIAVNLEPGRGNGPRDLK